MLFPLSAGCLVWIMKVLNGDFVRIKDEGRRRGKGTEAQRHRVKEKDKGIRLRQGYDGQERQKGKM